MLHEHHYTKKNLQNKLHDNIFPFGIFIVKLENNDVKIFIYYRNCKFTFVLFFIIHLYKKNIYLNNYNIFCNMYINNYY